MYKISKHFTFCLVKLSTLVWFTCWVALLSLFPLGSKNLSFIVVFSFPFGHKFLLKKPHIISILFYDTVCHSDFEISSEEFPWNYGRNVETFSPVTRFQFERRNTYTKSGRESCHTHFFWFRKIKRCFNTIENKASLFYLLIRTLIVCFVDHRNRAVCP